MSPEPPFPEVSDAVLAAIALRAGIPQSPIERLHSTGVVNAVWAVGDRWVVRVPRADDDSVAETMAERVAAPLAFAAGVRTPRLVLFDDTRELVPVPYTVFERADGVPLGTLSIDHAHAPRLWEAVGADLARLHAAPVPDFGLPSEVLEDPHPRLLALRSNDALRPPQLAWFTDWIARLEPALTPVSPVLLHDDAHPMNVLVDADGGYAALLDWGDAGVGDPAIEFAAMPLRAVPAALQGYRSVRPLDDAAEGRILRAHIAIALWLLGPDRKPGWPGPAVRLTELLRFVAEGPHFGFEPWLPTSRRLA